MVENIQKEIERIVEKLISAYLPEMIILFGSYANERYRVDSDVDLLIVKRTRKKPIWRRVEVRKIIDTNIPMDIIVLTPEEFLQLKNSKSGFLLEILKTGKILYEKSPHKNTHLFKMNEVC